MAEKKCMHYPSLASSHHLPLARAWARVATSNAPQTTTPLTLILNHVAIFIFAPTANLAVKNAQQIKFSIQPRLSATFQPKRIASLAKGHRMNRESDVLEISSR